MLRPCLLATVLVLALPLAAVADDGSAPDLSASVSSCGDGVGVFTGSMPTAKDANRLAMRFTLQTRTGDDSFDAVRLPAFGSFQRSKAGVGGFVLDKRVVRLVPGADYRAVVDFRWYDEDGKVLKKAQRTSAACEQDETRPDLRPTAITPVPGSGYAVTIKNDGPGTVTGSFGVGLAVGPARSPTVTTVGALPAGQTTTLRFPAADCAPGTRLTALADAANSIDEADEDDNTLVTTC